MNKTILLAVDAARHVQAAVDMTRELSQDSGDKVVVLHVHEMAIGRFGRIRVDCGEGEGEALVDSIVTALGEAGITAEGQVREADFGHLSRKILAVADELDARIIVLGSRGRTDMPHLPLGSVSHRLLHVAHRPVLIVPRAPVPETVTGTAAQAPAATAGAAG
jgi:nucleotide-binding universal stress UspA family protein